MTLFIHVSIYLACALLLGALVFLVRTVLVMRQAPRWERRAPFMYAQLWLLALLLAISLFLAITDTADMVGAWAMLLLAATVMIVCVLVRQISDQRQEDTTRVDRQYEHIREQLSPEKTDKLSCFCTDLTSDRIESCAGTDLYEGDDKTESFSALVQKRREYLLISPDMFGKPAMLSREKLLERFAAGETEMSEIVFCRRQNGRHCFVNRQVALAQDPKNGNVMAFFSEEDYNGEAVKRTVWQRVVADRCDFVAWLAAGQLGVILSYDGDTPRPGCFQPQQDLSLYPEFISECVSPILRGTDRERQQILSALDLNTVQQNLSKKDSYEVQFSCEYPPDKLDKTRNKLEPITYKRFTFVVADRTAEFYVLLVSDVTDLLSVQAENIHRLESDLHEAKRANAAKTTFLSNMSHDIRTPMNAIIGFTNLAKQSMDDREKTGEYLDKIQASSNHLLSLINDVLEMSRIESGKIELDETVCSLPEILHNLHTIIVGQVEGKQQELMMDAVNVHNERIFCDKLRLNQVLLNLLSNAVKYTPSGGKIAVRIIQNDTTVDGYGDYEIHVKDNGIGMTPEFAEKVFDAFEREKTATVNGIQGTGLGMAITKRIIDLMGGTIEVFTAPNEGSEFVVRTSFRVVDEQDKEQRIAALDGIHALVVDDDFDACDSTTNMLVQMGLRSEWTLFGKEAVLRAKQAAERGDGFGVFIIDWRLPDLNGLETIRQIRRAVGDSPTILLMTAYDWPIIRDEAIEAGVNGFCNKPLFMSELHSALVRAISSAEDRQLVEPEQDHESIAKVDFTGKRLLLVDDMLINRELAVTILEMNGFDVEEAGDGSQAVEMVRTSAPGHYDAILMDVQMPVMNGYEATRAIRDLSDPKLCSIPIIAMTANAFDEDRQAAISAGMNGHLAKPIDVAQLIKVLTSVLDVAPDAAPAAKPAKKASSGKKRSAQKPQEPRPDKAPKKAPKPKKPEAPKPAPESPESPAQDAPAADAESNN